MGWFEKKAPKTVDAVLRKAAVTDMPPPWRKVRMPMVGGVTDVGFVPDSETLVVVTVNGQGVIDCLTGDLIHRDPNDDGVDWEQCKVRNLADPDGALIELAGVSGGTLPLTGVDGWSVLEHVAYWPMAFYVACPPGASVEYATRGWARSGKDARFYKIVHDYEAVACGFSPTGKTLVWVSSSDLIVWTCA